MRDRNKPRSTLKEGRKTGFGAAEDIGNVRGQVHFLRRLETEAVFTVRFQNTERAEAKKVFPGPAGEAAAALATAYFQADFDD